MKVKGLKDDKEFQEAIRKVLDGIDELDPDGDDFHSQADLLSINSEKLGELYNERMIADFKEAEEKAEESKVSPV